MHERRELRAVTDHEQNRFPITPSFDSEQPLDGTRLERIDPKTVIGLCRQGDDAAVLDDTTDTLRQKDKIGRRIRLDDGHAMSWTCGFCVRLAV